MTTHSADGNKIYYIETEKLVAEQYIICLLTEPFAFNDRYEYIYYKGILVINGENIEFITDTTFRDIRFFSTSENAVFLFENKRLVLDALMPTFKKFFRNCRKTVFRKNM